MPTAEPRRRVGIYTGGELGSLQAKMAHGILRYVDDVEVVVDPPNAPGRGGGGLDAEESFHQARLSEGANDGAKPY